MKNIFLAIYAQPEGYPPTLNAINVLAKTNSKIYLLGRNVLIPTWEYPVNCSVAYSSEYSHVRDTEKKSILTKCKYFFDFLVLLFTQTRRQNPDVLLAYDPMALFACWLVLPFLKKKPVFWYHNHDVFEESLVRKYSIQWWAGKFEKKIFKHLNIFSLPANERKKHFPMKSFNGKFFFIPNFPSVNFFGSFYKSKPIKNSVRLIFQGAISTGHGLEEITGLLNQSVNGKELHLTVKGWIRDQEFKSKLESIAYKINSENRLEFVGYGPYKDLPLLTASCHIGIGIHAMATDLHTSLGSASNKLYEYACLGLPILVYDNEHYRAHLSKYSWVFFTDLSSKSLLECIYKIVIDYDQLSWQAHYDFENELNFELGFKEVVNYLDMPK